MDLYSESAVKFIKNIFANTALEVSVMAMMSKDKPKRVIGIRTALPWLCSVSRVLKIIVKNERKLLFKYKFRVITREFQK